MEISKQLIDDIKEAEYVIVGVGEKFGYEWKLLEADARYNELVEIIEKTNKCRWVIPYLQKVAMDENKDEVLANAYDKIVELIADKDAYVVTTTIDDYVYDSDIPLDRIVTPCGGFKKLQCEKACCNEITNLPLPLLKYVENLYNNMMSLDEIQDKYPECPFCGANLVFNQIGCENYVEAGYIRDWALYREWLEKTMNRRVVLLELGVGLGFMSVIRSPFEKLAEYNLKSKMYRVHPTLYMGTPQISERCISVQADPRKWILEVGRG